VLFQTLDNKDQCIGIYCDGGLIFNAQHFPQELDATWSYAPYLRDREIEYASLYLEGKNLKDYVPEYLEDDWGDVSSKIRAFNRSLEIAAVDREETCFYDLVPERFLMDYCEVKNQITQHILQTIPRPDRYTFHRAIAQMIGDIGSRTVQVDHAHIRALGKSPQLRGQAETLLSCTPRVDYNAFGTITGRLTTKKKSFPILTMNKSFRSAVSPTNDFYVELDFNGAEIRTLLGLLGHQQPTEDVHEFHLHNIFTQLSSRDDAKVAFFAWLYGGVNNSATPHSKKLEAYYDKAAVLEKYWVNGDIITPYKKKIKDVDAHHALNYLVQSTAAELTLKQALKLDYVLRTRGSGSFIAFLVHDAVILDLKNEDIPLLKILVELMGSTNFGKFGVNLKKGKTLGALEKYSLG